MMLQSEQSVYAPADYPILDFEKARSATLATRPFDYLIVSDFIRPEWQNRLIAAYPAIKKGGSFPLSTVHSGERLHQAYRCNEWHRVQADC